jgi:hypothetical protein
MEAIAREMLGFRAQQVRAPRRPNASSVLNAGGCQVAV